MGTTTIVAGVIGAVVGAGIGVGATVAVYHYKESKRIQRFRDQFKDIDLTHSNVNFNIS